MMTSVNTGFTTVLPVQPVQTPAGTGPGSRMIYVSSSTGSDFTGNGTITNPYATAAFGATFIRLSGFSDQLLLKCGDTFQDDTVVQLSSGRFKQSGVAPTLISGNYVTGPTIQGPILIGTYGAGPRPYFPYTTLGVNAGAVIGKFFAGETATDGINVIIQGINIYAACRDPSSPFYAGATAVGAEHSTYGIFFIASTAWNGLLMIEDCVIDHFVNNIDVEGPDLVNGVQALLTPNFNLVLRRNIITNSYVCVTNVHSQGLFTHSVGNLWDIENFWDHNGWNEDPTLLNTGAGSGATIFNRNIYDGNSGMTVQGNVTRISQGSIHARGSSNTQFRPGCDISDGLFFKNCVGGVDIGENFGTSYNTDSHTSQTRTVQRNVVLESTDIPSSIQTPGGQAGGAGLLLNNISNAILNNNIVTQCDPASANAIAVTWTPTGGNNTMSNNVVTNLIIFNTNTAYTSTLQTSQVDVSSSTNYVDLAGTNTGSAPEPFPHPNPTNTSLLDDYWASLGNPVINSGGLDFLQACAARSGNTWDRRLSAYGANDYIQSGFNVAYRS